MPMPPLLAVVAAFGCRCLLLLPVPLLRAAAAACRSTAAPPPPPLAAAAANLHSRHSLPSGCIRTATCWSDVVALPSPRYTTPVGSYSEPRSSCTRSESYSNVADASSYADSLAVDASIAASGGFAGFGAAFKASAGYKSASNNAASSENCETHCSCPPLVLAARSNRRPHACLSTCPSNRLTPCSLHLLSREGRVGEPSL